MTVIPVDQATWSTLVMLRDSIGFMKEKDRTKYSLAIDKEERLYKYMIEEVLEKKVA